MSDKLDCSESIKRELLNNPDFTSAAYTLSEADTTKIADAYATQKANELSGERSNPLGAVQSTIVQSEGIDKYSATSVGMAIGGFNAQANMGSAACSRLR